MSTNPNINLIIILFKCLYGQCILSSMQMYIVLVIRVLEYLMSKKHLKEFGMEVMDGSDVFENFVAKAHFIRPKKSVKKIFH